MTFFILGVQPALSLAELRAVLGKEAKFVATSDEVVIVDGDLPEPAILQDRLSGVVKVGRILSVLDSWKEETVADLIAAYAAGTADEGKISFGMSVYDLGNKAKASGIRRDTRRVGMQVKKHLKGTGRSVRFVTSNEPTLSSVVVETNNLLTSGGEFVLLAAANAIYLGQTSSVQDFAAWSNRDYGRPARDAKSGMLPPKLARLMINLAGVDPAGAVILDPFCGSGTVLMEAALMGAKKMIGSDIDSKAMEATRKNLAWLEQQEGRSMPETILFASDVADIVAHVTEPVDLIVAEGYLGPPLKGRETKDEMKKNIAQLVTLYENALSQLRRVIAPTGSAVIAFPAFHITNAWLRLPIARIANENGWDIQPPSPFIYARPKQHVGRDIFVLTPRP